MPTMREQRAKLAAFKQELETQEERMSEPGVFTMMGAEITDEGTSWNEVITTATNAQNNLKFTLTEDDLQQLVSYLAANPDRVVIDYDHEGDEGGSTRAAGWFTGEAKVVAAGEENPRGETQDNASVWAVAKWTPAAAQQIRDGEFRFMSAVIEFQRMDPKTKLATKFRRMVAATITNRPFFKQLAPLIAKELIDSERLDALAESYSPDVAELVLASLETEDERMTKAAEAVLAASSKTEADDTPVVTDPGDNDNTKETTVADEQPVTDYMKMLGLDETVDPKHRLAAAFREKDEKILTLEQRVTELTASSGEKTKEAEELAERIEGLEQKDRERDISVLLTRAIDKGRILPSEREVLTELFAKDVNGLKRLIATKPEGFVTDRLAPQGAAGEPDRFVDDPDIAQLASDSMFKSEDARIDTEQGKQHLVAMELLKEQGKATTYTDDEYVAAYTRAEKLVY